MLLSAARSCLVVVDVQERLAPAIANAEAVVARVSIVMRAAQRLGIPILVTEQYPKGLGPSVAAVAALAPPGATVSKVHFSSAAEPEFASRVEALDRDQLVVVGMEAHVCVLQTALGLAESGYRVAVVADAVGSRREQDRALALERMRAAGLTIVSSEMVVFEWLHRAATPEFKEVSALIK